MSYERRSIKEMMEMIGRGEVYLPAIQRKFVWAPEQIESLFDSIMRGYPIGTFLFWYVHERKNDYTFYKFLQDYHERDRYLNDPAPNPHLPESIIGILDGQQRLNSMYIAMQGTYAYKKPYARRETDSAYPRRVLYLNLLREPLERDGEDFLYQFEFLPSDEKRTADSSALWFPVREVLKWGKDPRADEYYEDLLDGEEIPSDVNRIISDKARRMQIKKMISTLHQRVVTEQLINYYRLEEQDLDQILDIFVRVNSGGTILSKSDLLFSTIVAAWESGRSEIESFITSINNKRDPFFFDTDFIMRSCLVLADLPILFKVNSFKRENIETIKRKWESIKTAIQGAVDLLVEWGFSGERLPSRNAVIPIAYHLMKHPNPTPQVKSELRRFLIQALLKQIFGSQGDQVLSKLRDAFRADESAQTNSFQVKHLTDAALPGGRSLRVLERDIDEILEYRKGAYTFMVLSLLYPHLKFAQVQFHQDHIHPDSSFTDAKLRKEGLPPESWHRLQEMKDKLPNLQLMAGRENESKNKTPFEEWILGKDGNGSPNVPNVDSFKSENYIPPAVSLALKDFESFYEARKQRLRVEILKLLL